jgi:hypothetical protein
LLDHVVEDKMNTLVPEIPVRLIPPGTLVFDSTGKPLGEVEYVQTADLQNADETRLYNDTLGNRQYVWSFSEDILEKVFQGDDLFDGDLTERLERYGYINILMAGGGGYFVTGDQVDHEEGGALFLKVQEGQLLRYR